MDLAGPLFGTIFSLENKASTYLGNYFQGRKSVPFSGPNNWPLFVFFAYGAKSDGRRASDCWLGERRPKSFGRKKWAHAFECVGVARCNKGTLHIDSFCGRPSIFPTSCKAFGSTNGPHWPKTRHKMDHAAYLCWERLRRSGYKFCVVKNTPAHATAWHCIYIYIHISIYKYVYIYIYIHIYIYIYIYIYIIQIYNAYR